MKIQDLAIIFVIIILPISIVLSAYAQYQIQTINTQTLYDTKLTAATYDAIKAYQLNAENNSRSELANSKIKDIEASVATFRNSIMNTFRLNGYTEEQLDSYIPALVYTMYDGFYIYSPYTNTNYQYDDAGNATQDNGSDIYGLKPYIPYSCRYIKGDIDVVITYALENFITVRGTVNGEYVNESGYLVDGVSANGTRYNDVTIETEQLREYLPIPRADMETVPEAYPYVKLNGTKYYRVDRYKIDELGNYYGDDSIIYIANGEIIEQCKVPKRSDFENDDEYKNSSAYLRYQAYSDLIDNNYSAIQYYNDAAKFTFKVRNELNLSGLTYADAYDIDGTSIWPGNTTPIFDSSINIENELSNFNQHRLAVIRHTIENNLAIAIANYNNYSNSPTNDFQMPKLKEDEWDYITHNISLISFLQGLHIGGKVYNGYTIVTNSESEEVVLEPNIYMLGDDGNYHRIGDKTIEDGGTTSVGNLTETTYGATKSAGRLNLDFRRKTLTNGTSSTYYYPLHEYNASYDSVIMRENVTTYQDIYEYINDGTKIPDYYKQAFYIALGRERAGKYNSTITINANGIIGGSMATPDVGGTPSGGGTPEGDDVPETYTVTFDANGGNVTPTSIPDLSSGDIIELPTPTKSDCVFAGWSAPLGGLYNGGDSYTVKGNITFTANWEAITYTVTFDANGGNVTPTLVTNLSAGDTIELPTPTKSDCVFAGWSASIGGNYSAGAHYIVNENVTFTANWEAITYTVTFDANGGNVTPTLVTNLSAGDTIELPTPTKSDCVFVGWSSSTGENYSAGAHYIVNENVTFIANWMFITYCITYDANGGEVSPDSTSVTPGTEITIPNPMERPGYRFIGWAIGEGSTEVQYLGGEKIIPTGDMDFIAVWEKIIAQDVKITYYEGIVNENETVSNIPAVQSTIKGETLTITNNKPTKIATTTSVWGSTTKKEIYF